MFKWQDKKKAVFHNTMDFSLKQGETHKFVPKTKGPPHPSPSTSIKNKLEAPRPQNCPAKQEEPSKAALAQGVWLAVSPLQCVTCHRRSWAASHYFFHFSTVPCPHDNTTQRQHTKHLSWDSCISTDTGPHLWNSSERQRLISWQNLEQAGHRLRVFFSCLTKASTQSCKTTSPGLETLL